MFVYELSGCGFKPSCSQLVSDSSRSSPSYLSITKLICLHFHLVAIHLSWFHLSLFSLWYGVIYGFMIWRYICISLFDSITHIAAATTVLPHPKLRLMIIWCRVRSTENFFSFLMRIYCHCWHVFIVNECCSQSPCEFSQKNVMKLALKLSNIFFQRTSLCFCTTFRMWEGLWIFLMKAHYLHSYGILTEDHAVSQLWQMIWASCYTF